MSRIDLAAAISPIVTKAIADRVFPGAVIEVGRTNGPIDRYAAGTLTYAPGSDAVSANTIYDLASLTKVIATTALVAGEFAAGRMRLNDRVRHWIALVDRRRTAVRHAARSARACVGITRASPILRVTARARVIRARNL